MNVLISCVLIPFLTVFASGGKDFLTSNFSVTADSASGQLYLFLWAALSGVFFRFLIRRIIGQAAALLTAGHEPALADLSVSFLLAAVLIPYRPKRYRLLSALHILFALSASVIWYLVLLSLALRFYFADPRTFAGMTAVFLYSAFLAAALFLLSDFIVSSALEIFVTVFSGLWLTALSFLLAKPPE